MRRIDQSTWKFLLIPTLLALTACSLLGGVAAQQNGDSGEPIDQQPMEESPLGLNTPVQPTELSSGAGNADKDRWQTVIGWEGSFSLVFDEERDEVDPVLNWPQSVRSSRSASGIIQLELLEEGTWFGTGTMSWFVDDFLEVQDETGTMIRSATALGEGETLLDDEETLLWIDFEEGIYGLAIFPAGLYDTMEVLGTETFEGMEQESVIGPVGQYGLMDTAGIAAWFEGRTLPTSGLEIEGSTELADGTVFTWDLAPLP